MSVQAGKRNSNLVSEQSMHFWGLTCLSSRYYEQVVGERFHLTMAVLDPKSAPEDDEIDKTVSLFVKRGESEFLLCVLKHGEIFQVNLNLIFDKGENVVFHVRGHGDICLSGFAQTEIESDVLRDEVGYFCPLAEVKPEAKNPSPESEQEAVSPKSKKKAKRDKNFVTSEDRKTLKSWDSMANRKKNGEIKVLEFKDDESDESSDEDFSIGEESSESQESEEYDENESEEDLEEEIIKLKDDDGELMEEQEMIETEPEGPSGSRKRKLEKKSQPKENSFNNKDSSDSDVEELPTVDTPIPKKTMKTENSSEKKSKKKKKLNESNSSEKFVIESTPKSKENTETTPNRNPVQKLEGGVEVQDVIEGRGPVATKGKMVHVFYVGRLQNKEIFDSRLPGKKPFSFKLGAQQVIKGWDIGLQGMKVGGKRKLKIPPSMGYGSSRLEDIPPNSTLFFLVELQAIN